MKETKELYILYKACNIYNISLNELLGSVRKRHIVDARKMVGYYLYTLGYTLTYIGKILGGKDHTTIIHYVRTFPHLMNHDEEIKEKYTLMLTKEGFTSLKYKPKN